MQANLVLATLSLFIGLGSSIDIQPSEMSWGPIYIIPLEVPINTVSLDQTVQQSYCNTDVEYDRCRTGYCSAVFFPKDLLATRVLSLNETSATSWSAYEGDLQATPLKTDSDVYASFFGIEATATTLDVLATDAPIPREGMPVSSATTVYATSLSAYLSLLFASVFFGFRSLV